MKKFSIFTFPRSGSTYLCSRLGKHPNILCHYDLFHPNEIGTAWGFNDKAPKMGSFTPLTRDADPATFLRTLFEYDLGADAVGFKYHFGHGKEAYDPIVNDRSIAKILLTRSPLDVYVSRQIAWQTGQWTGAPSEKPIQATLDAAALLAFDKHVHQTFAVLEERLSESDQPYLKVAYEDIVADEAAFNSIFQFLGIDRGDDALTPFTERQNSEAIEDKVSNVKQVIEDLIRLHREADKT